MRITQRLKCYEGLDIFYPSSDEILTMRQRFNAQPLERRRRVVFRHRLLLTEYNLLRMKIVAGFNQTIQPHDLEDNIKEAAQVAEMLSVIYGFYLHVPREAHGFQADLKRYQKWLGLPEKTMDDLPKLEGEKLIFLRTSPTDYNFYRLFPTRLRRLLILTAVFTAYDSWLRQGLDFMNNQLYGDVFFNHIGYIWFIPRLLTNTLLLLNHVVPDKGLSKEETSLGAQWRLYTQLDRRWMQLSNDWVWVIGGIANAFLFVGPWTPISMYVTVAMFAFDVVCAGLNAYIELSRLNQLSTQYRALGIDDIMLKKHMRLEQARLILAIINTSILCLGMAVAIPALGLAPHLVLAGAVAIITSTLATFIILRIIEHQRAPANLASVADKTLQISNNPSVFFQPDPFSRKREKVLAPPVAP